MGVERYAPSPFPNPSHVGRGILRTQLAHGSSLVVEEPFFSPQPPAIVDQVSIPANDPAAGNDDGDRISVTPGASL